MPKPTLLDRWIVALRSEEYKQGRKKLKVGDRFCCLGVLCDLSKVGEWRDSPYESLLGQHQSYLVKFYPATSTVLPSPVLGALAFGAPWFDFSVQDDLVHMNDNMNKTFDEIADYLEHKHADWKKEQADG